MKKVTEFVSVIAANKNSKPLPKIKFGLHAGRIDLNALRGMKK